MVPTSFYGVAVLVAIGLFALTLVLRGTQGPKGIVSAEGREKQAAALIAEGKINTAVEELNAIIRQEPANAQAHYDLGAALFRQNKFSEAVEEFGQALRLKPKFGRAHTGIGMAYVRLQRNNDAISEFYEALRSDSRDADAHYYLGVLLASKNMLNEAIDEYRQALSVDPRYASVYSGLAAANLARGNRAKHSREAARYFTAAWQDARVGQSLGGFVDPSVLAALRQRVPDAAEDHP